MNRLLSGVLAWALLAALPGVALGDERVKMAGRIIGEQCALAGKIGECYLKWADPMVFWTEEGDTFAIDLAASNIKQERLDEAFGLEVEVYGQVADEPDGASVQISQLNILNPPGKKEFFKG